MTEKEPTEIKAGVNLKDSITDKNYSAKPKRSFLGKEMSIRGEITANEDLLINCKVENGSISVKNNRLEIGKNGSIKSNAVAKVVIIHGEIRGDVYASEHALLKPTAKVFGNIFAADIRIEDGAFFKGKIDMRKQDFSSPNTTEVTENSIQKLDRPQDAHSHAYVYEEYQHDDKSVIGESIVIKGEIRSEEDVLLYGKMEGIVYFKNNTVEIAPNAQIAASPLAKTIIAYGQISGNIYASENVVVKKVGHVTGKIYSPRINIESGAIVEGSVEMEAQVLEKVFADMIKNSCDKHITRSEHNQIQNGHKVTDKIGI